MRNTLHRVQEYNNITVTNRIQTEFCLSEEEAVILFEDTKMFLFLSTVTDRAIIPTVEIDKGWHIFLLFTKDYAQFCFNCLGKFVHHTPFKPGYVACPNSVQDTISLARQYFTGELSLSHNWLSSKITKADCSPETNCEAEPADCALNIEQDELAYPI